MKPVLMVVLVDAMGWRLAGQDPAFAPLLDQRRPLGTILGFSSGALPTAFTGQLPREHGRWLMYRRAAGEGVFHGFGLVPTAAVTQRALAGLCGALSRGLAVGVPA